MPIYTYNCGLHADLELNVKIADRDEEQKCPHKDCGQVLDRMVDAPGAVYAPTAKGGLAT